MTEMELLRAILDSYPYAIVYVDSDFIIRYMNRYARYHYCVERRYGDLIDKVFLTAARLNPGKNRRRVPRHAERRHGAVHRHKRPQSAHLYAARSGSRRKDLRLFRAV